MRIDFRLLVSLLGQIRPVSLGAIIGGIVAGISIFLPIFSVQSLISEEITPIDLGLQVFASMGIAAIIAVVAGYSFYRPFEFDARTLLAGSILALGVSWFGITIQLENYQISYDQYGELALPLQLELGFFLLAGATCLVLFTFALVTMNYSLYAVAEVEPSD